MSKIEVKNLDNLGIVVGIIDEIGIEEIVNSKLGIDSREKITSGQIVKAILLNELGFVSRPLYLFSQVFEDKGVEELLGKGVESKYINDDKIGRVMDGMYRFGLNALFIEIVLLVVKKFEIETKYAHLDATSFPVDGEDKSEAKKEEKEEIIKERPIIITKGYSRNHRPDFKQCVWDLITSSDGDIPLFMRAGDGNEADKAVFGQILVELKKPINLDSILVCDSALYSQENLQLIKLLKWISRVPMTIKKAQELGRTVEIEEIDAKEISRRADLGLEGYNWKESRVNYGGIEQIWLVVESKKKLKKEGIKLEKLLKKLKREEFDNPQQARYKLKGINITIKLFKIEESKIIEGQSKKKELIYKIEGVLQPQVEEIAIGRKEAGRFILATKWLKID